MLFHHAQLLYTDIVECTYRYYVLNYIPNLSNSSNVSHDQHPPAKLQSHLPPSFPGDQLFLLSLPSPAESLFETSPLPYNVDKECCIQQLQFSNNYICCHCSYPLSIGQLWITWVCSWPYPPSVEDTVSNHYSFPTIMYTTIGHIHCLLGDYGLHRYAVGHICHLLKKGNCITHQWGTWLVISTSTNYGHMLAISTICWIRATVHHASALHTWSVTFASTNYGHVLAISIICWKRATMHHRSVLGMWSVTLWSCISAEYVVSHICLHQLWSHIGVSIRYAIGHTHHLVIRDVLIMELQRFRSFIFLFYLFFVLHCNHIHTSCLHCTIWVICLIYHFSLPVCYIWFVQWSNG